MITASHLPFNRNGFKFFDANAGFEKSEIAELLQRASEAAEGDDLADPSFFPADKSQASEDVVKQLAEELGTNASKIVEV